MWGLLEILIVALLAMLVIVLLRTRGRKANNIETVTRKRVRLTIAEARSVIADLTEVVEGESKWSIKTRDLQRGEAPNEIITFEVRK